MAYIRRLASGKWQATLRGPDGKRHTKTHALKKFVADWAREQEGLAIGGVWRDPRAGDITLAEWHQRWWSASSSRFAKRTQKLYAMRWRRQIEPHLGSWRLGSLAQIDLEGWVDGLLREGNTRTSVTQAITVVKSMLTAAVRSNIISVSPAQFLSPPHSVPKPLETFERAEYDALRAAAQDDPCTHALLGLVMHVGLRWGEVAALRGDRVEWLRQQVEVIDVMDGDGSVREYPKSSRSRRTVPVPAEVVEEMAGLMEGRDRRSLVFTAPQGGLLHASNWRTRVWIPLLQRAGVRYRKEHTMRSTAASWLVMAGVDLYRVQALLGHESFATTQRYAHLQPDAHSAITSAWETMARDARVTHAAPRGRPDFDPKPL